MATANGAVLYKPVDGGKLGYTGATPAGANTAVKQWAGGKTWLAGDICQNGGFLFSTVAGGAGAASGVGPTPQYLTDNACTWVLVGPVGHFNQSEAAQSQDLGYTVFAKDYGPNAYGIAEMQYVKFTGATNIVAGDFVQIDRQGMTATQSPTALASANSPVVIGIAMASHALATATPTYGWVMVRGVHDGANVTTGGTAGYCCSLGAAAGRVIGGGYVANKSIEAAFLRNAAAANNVGTVELYWPFASGR